MGGRGSSALSYQGKNGGSGKAYSTGINVSQMAEKLKGLAQNVVSDKRAQETIRQINSIRNKEDKVTIYRATIGDTINPNDWVFLSKEQAERWAKTPLGRPKPGVKVIKSMVPAKEVDWTGKNLEFVYKGRKRRK